MGIAVLANTAYNETIGTLSQIDSERFSNQFVNEHKNFVYATALRYIKDYDDADDITQEVFIKALNSWSKFEHKSSVKTWLYKITVNMCLNYQKRSKFLTFFSKMDNETISSIKYDEHNAQENMESNEVFKRFNEELAKLPEKQRETFALRYFHELSYNEISELLGTSVGGLKANYFQAVKKLAGNLKDIR